MSSEKKRETKRLESARKERHLGDLQMGLRRALEKLAKFDPDKPDNNEIDWGDYADLDEVVITEALEAERVRRDLKAKLEVQDKERRDDPDFWRK